MLVESVSFPLEIRASRTHAYWIPFWQDVAQRVMRVPLAGDEPPSVSVVSAEGPEAFTFDVGDEHVYWSALADGPSPAGSVLRAPLEGGSPQVLSNDEAADLAVAGEGVFWVGASTGNLSRWRPGTGTTVIASGFDAPRDLTVADGWAFVRHHEGVSAVRTDGGAVTRLTNERAGGGWPMRQRPAAGDGYVYWGETTDSGERIVRAPYGGGATEEVLACSGPVGPLKLDAGVLFLVVEDDFGRDLGRFDVSELD